MPKCRYCNMQISKFDKDVCPSCGRKNPLDGITDETVDFTHIIETSPEEENLEVTFKSKTVAGVLAIILGVLGVHNFYLGKYKLALINIAETLVGVGLGLILFFYTSLGVWAFLIPYFVILAYDIWVGVTFFTHNDLKDGKGEILR